MIIAKVIAFNNFIDTFSFILETILSICTFTTLIKNVVKIPQNIEYSKHTLSLIFKI